MIAILFSLESSIFFNLVFFSWFFFFIYLILQQWVNKNTFC